MAPLRQRIESALARLRIREGDPDLMAAGLVREIRIDEGAVEVELAPETVGTGIGDTIRLVLAGVEGVDAVRVKRAAGGGAAPGGAAGAGRPAGPEPPEGSVPTGRSGRGRPLPVVGPAGAGAAAGAAAAAAGGGHAGAGGSPGQVSREEASRHPSEAEPLEGVGHVVAVSSGKGGVGKSTIATNLAAAWAAEGYRVGLLDADIYGPDIPTMFGVHEKPRMAENQVIPLEAHGVKLMSLGFLVDEDTPAVWRGPIIMGIVRQFLRQVRWGELDYLLVDLPPGTGDAQLSLVQLVRVSGAVMVTTPQDVSVGGVLKGIRMFESVEVPVLGIVENMRGFACPDCGKVWEIFGSGGGEKLAASLELPFLGAVPLGMAVREEGDRGVPTAVGRPDSPEGRALREIARTTRKALAEPAERAAGP